MVFGARGGVQPWGKHQHASGDGEMGSGQCRLLLRWWCWCCRMEPRACRERRQADSIGTPLGCVCPSICVPLLWCAVMWPPGGEDASLGDAGEHQLTQGPGNYRGHVRGMELDHLQPQGCPQHWLGSTARVPHSTLRCLRKDTGGQGCSMHAAWVCLHEDAPGTRMSHFAHQPYGNGPWDVGCGPKGSALDEVVPRRWDAMGLLLLQNVPLAFRRHLGPAVSFHPAASLRDMWPLGWWKSKRRVVKLELQSAAGAGDGKGSTASVGPGPRFSSCAFLQEEPGLRWSHILEVKKLGLMCLVW